MLQGTLIPPDIDPASLESAFHRKIGEVLAEWGHIESALCTFFERLTGMSHALARNIFYSPAGLDGRIRMLNATLDATSREPELAAFLRLLLGKVRNYAGSRNKIAHGDVLLLDVPGSKYASREPIILEGRAALGDDAPEGSDVLTVSGLELTLQNFQRVTRMLLAALNWDKADPDMSPAKLQELIPLLPKMAHSDQLDPNNADKFQLGPETLLIWR